MAEPLGFTFPIGIGLPSFLPTWQSSGAIG
jgi:hypothetical protein